MRALSFNQDATCIAIADEQGIKIYSLDTHKLCYQQDIGAVSVAEMLFCTSLLAFVGAGEQPALTPRKLTLLNTSNQNIIQELNFQYAVLGVRLNRRRLVAIMERAVNVYSIDTLKLLQTLETPPNPKGVGALGSCSDPCLLVLPSSTTSGAVRLYDLLASGGSLLVELTAHRAPVAALAWNADCSLLASASSKGTVVRVHRPSDAAKAFTFRRGATPSTITCLAFTPPGLQPPLLCAASEHGTIHVFRLAEPDRHPAAQVATGLLAAVMPHSMADVVEPQRTCATVRLPCTNIASVCAVLGPFTRADVQGGASGSGEDEGDAIMIAVATVDGILYEYWLTGLGAKGSAVKCSLEGESYLFGHSYGPDELPG